MDLVKFMRMTQMCIFLLLTDKNYSKVYILMIHLNWFSLHVKIEKKMNRTFNYDAMTKNFLNIFHCSLITISFTERFLRQNTNLEQNTIVLHTILLRG